MNIHRHYEMPETAEADRATWFANSQRAALNMADEQRQAIRRIDRLVNWTFTAIIVGFGVWAVFA